MKTRQRTKAGEPRWYESAAQPSAPGELTKAEPEQKTDVGVNSRWLRWIVGVYLVVATFEVALGRWFDSVYWASIAFFFAVSLQPRERVPKPLRYFALAIMLVLTDVEVVLLLLDRGTA